VTTYSFWNSEWVLTPEPVKTTPEGAWNVEGLVPGAMYGLQPDVPGAHLDSEQGLLEVDREGKPTDLGLLMMR
jgi:hypothetical protein